MLAQLPERDSGVCEESAGTKMIFTGFIAGLIVGVLAGGMLVYVFALPPARYEDATFRIFEELEGDFHE